MRLLLDTHALLWYALADRRLSQVAQDLIVDAGNLILISPASYWEIAIKLSLGKQSLHRPYEEFVDTCLTDYGFVILPIQPRHTGSLITLPFTSGHKDPFDRLLVAQAIVEGIPIVSADPALAPYGVRRLW